MKEAADNFNRPDGPLGPLWTYFFQHAEGIEPVVHNGGYGNRKPGLGFGAAFYRPNGAGFAPDQIAEAVVRSVDEEGTDSICGLVVRGSIANGGSGYFCLVGTNTYLNLIYCHELWRVKNGKLNWLAAGMPGIPIRPGDLIALRVQGSHLGLWENGREVLSVEDTEVSAGEPGVCCDSGDGSEGKNKPSDGTTFGNWRAVEL